MRATPPIDGTRSRLRAPRPLATIGALALIAVPLGLGIWQVERRAWKHDLIAARTEALAATPIVLGGARTDWAGVDFQPAVATGRFRHDLEMIVLGRAGRDQPGVHVATPLVLSDGGTLLVDRGWVPMARRDPAARRGGQIDGVVTVRGVLRQPEAPGYFTPPSRPDLREFYHADLPAMARVVGGGDVLPVLLEASADPVPGGYPLGGQTQVTLRDNHLQYALTWFALAFGGAIVFLFRWLKGRGRP